MNGWTRRGWMAGLSMTVLLAAVWLVIRHGSTPGDREPKLEPGETPLQVEEEPPIVSVIEIPADALLSRPEFRETRREVAAATEPELAEAQPRETGTPRVALSPIFLPYAHPSAMVSSSAGERESPSPILSADTGMAAWGPEATGTLVFTSFAYANKAAMLSAATGSSHDVWITYMRRDRDAHSWTQISRDHRLAETAPTSPTAATDQPDRLARAMYFIREAEVAVSAGRMSDAIHAYGEALALYPDMAYGHQQLGRLRLLQGDYEPAIQHLQAALDTSEALSELLNDLGVAYLYSGRAEEALQSFEAAWSADPETTDALFNSGLALRRLGQIEEARNRFLRLLRLFPEDARGYRELAVLDLIQGNRDEARKQLELAMSIDPAWATPVLDAAMLFADLGEHVRAIDLLDRALTLVPARAVLQVYQQPSFRSIRLSPEGKPFESRLAAQARKQM